jgi:hypothetical protein
VLDKFKPECLAVLVRHLEKVDRTDGHKSAFAGVPYNHSDRRKRYGILVAMLQRVA